MASVRGSCCTSTTYPLSENFREVRLQRQVDVANEVGDGHVGAGGPRLGHEPPGGREVGTVPVAVDRRRRVRAVLAIAGKPGDHQLTGGFRREGTAEQVDDARPVDREVDRPARRDAVERGMRGVQAGEDRSDGRTDINLRRPP